MKNSVFVLLLGLSFLILSPCALFSRTSASTDTRLALVIGNGIYPNVPLKNTTNDARDMSAALQRLGFSVSLVIDGDLAAMNRAVRDFGNAIKGKDAVALLALPASVWVVSCHSC
jgi:hypothetical protein